LKRSYTLDLGRFQCMRGLDERRHPQLWQSPATNGPRQASFVLPQSHTHSHCVRL